MDKYYLKTTVQAEQFDGHGPILKDEYTIINLDGRFGYAHLLVCASGMFNLNKGDWIIRKANGHYDVMSDSEFKAKYSSKPDNYYQAETVKALNDAERTKVDIIFSHHDKLKKKLDNLVNKDKFQNNHIKQNEIDIKSLCDDLTDYEKKLAKLQGNKGTIFSNPYSLTAALTEKQKHCPYCHPGSKLPSIYKEPPIAWDGNNLKFTALKDSVVTNHGEYIDFDFNPVNGTLAAAGDGDPCVVEIKYCPFCRRKL